tara:strand:+ start:529 stop:1221 length:693 start_codon:yes stop_codon:yes gene_type:complete
MKVINFSKQIKLGTKKSHSAAENTAFVRSFLRGVVSEESYRTLISDLYFVYSAIEEEFRRLKDHFIVSKLYLVELERVSELERDLRYYYGPQWRSLISPSESAVQYVERIHSIADDEPYLLVAHHYTRYMGDLSGGQILKGIAKRSLPFTDYELKHGEGLKFYDFEKIDDVKAYKTKYRSILDSLPIDQIQADLIIDEANNAFKMNMNMFNELKGSWFKSLLNIIRGINK